MTEPEKLSLWFGGGHWVIARSPADAFEVLSERWQQPIEELIPSADDPATYWGKIHQGALAVLGPGQAISDPGVYHTPAELIAARGRGYIGGILG